MVRKLSVFLLFIAIIGCKEAGEEKNQANDKKSSPPPAASRDAIKESFAKLQDAMSKKDVEKMVALVAPSTYDIYERYRKLALDSSGTDLNSLPILDTMTIIHLRGLLSRSELEAMDGKDVFTRYVEQEGTWPGKLELGEIKVNGNTATAAPLTKDKHIPKELLFNFELHDGTWKMDICKCMKSAEPFMEMICRQMGATKTEFAIHTLEERLNKKVPPEILKGPLR